MLFGVDISGYKSIHDASISLRRINVVIGGNGTGKSNFISSFRLVKDVYNKNLQNSVLTAGGADRILHCGRKVTDGIKLTLHLGSDTDEEEINRFMIDLKEANDTLYISSLKTSFLSGRYWHDRDVESNVLESSFQYDHTGQSYYVNPIINSLDVYHFHDTGPQSALKKTSYLSDNYRLRPDGSNLASILYLIRHKWPAVLKDIEGMISSIYPLFNHFVLEPERLGEDMIKLHWIQNGLTDYIFNAGQLSDGTLRFIALVTLLMQPEIRGTIIIDEPELGLHPNAISILASLIKKASSKVQIIVSTQSVDLINNFTPEDIIVASRENNATGFKRLSSDELAAWMDDYTLGEMWIKNVFGE